MADIGDGDDQAPAAATTLAIDGIVEVPGIGAIDRHQGQIPEIDPVALGCLGHLVGNLGELLGSRLGPVLGNAMSQDRDIGLDARLVGGAENLDDAPDRGTALVRILDDLGTYDIAGLRAKRVVAPDQDLGPHVAVLEDVTDAALAMKLADDLCPGPGEHLDDTTLEAVTPAWHDAHGDPIAIEERPHLPAREIDIRFTVVTDQETETVTVRLDATGNELQRLGQSELARTIPQ